MNQFIVSQWFEYKDDLKSYFVDCISEAEHTKKLFRKLEYPCAYIPEICEEILIHLLKLVINRGRKSLKLRLLDSLNDNISDTCCCDTMFWLRDKRGYYWIISTFYGTFESMITMNRVGMTKEQWVTMLMHLSLGMVQSLRKCDEHNSHNCVVLRRSSFTCSIEHLVDLRGLNDRSEGQWRLRKTMEDMPRKAFEPLFALMSDEQKAEIEEILDSDDAEENQQLSEELPMFHHPEWRLALKGIGEERARQVVKKIEEMGLKGYIAVCFRQYYPPPVGYYYEFFWERMFEMMEEFANKFNGDIYFMAVGKTLNTLLKDIEKRTLEFERIELGC